MTKHTDSVLGWYKGFLKGWPAKLVGPAPTEAQLTAIHALGARPGKQALASAMALRDCGVTGSQIVIACGAPQLNKMRGFVRGGVTKWLPTPNTSDKNHKVYRMALTAKGEARIKRVTEAAALDAAHAAAPKAKRQRKAKAPEAAPQAAPEATPAPEAGTQ